MERSDSEDILLCPLCEGFPVQMGRLGNTIYYRCRQCGNDYYDLPDESDFSAGRSGGLSHFDEHTRNQHDQ